MKFRYSNEDVKNIHRLLMGGTKKHIETMPQYFKDEIAEFDTLYIEFTAVITDNEGVKVDVTDTIKEKNDWISDAYKQVRLFYYSVKGTSDKKLMSSYFNNKKLSEIISFDDLLNVTEQIKILSKNETISHLDKIIEEISELYKKGLIISQELKEKKVSSSDEVKVLSDKKNNFLNKYLKLKHLLKGYFHNTEINLKDILWD